MKSQVFLYDDDQQDEVIQQSGLVLPPGTKASQSYFPNVFFNGVKRSLIVGNLYKFILQPLPFALFLSCTIKRVSKGFISSQFQYECRLHNERKIILKCIPIESLTKAWKLIAMKKSATEQNHIATLVSNFMGTSFQLIRQQNGNKIQLAAINYQSNFLGLGPRKLKVFIPTLDQKDKPIIYPYEKDFSLADKFQGSGGFILKFVNKQPQYDEKTGKYQLDFYGRAKMASTKNFILKVDQGLKYENLLFGKISKDEFIMDVKYPLSLIQAFTICLSSIIKKFAVE